MLCRHRIRQIRTPNGPILKMLKLGIQKKTPF